MENILEAKNLTVGIDGKKVVDDVSFSLGKGKVTSIVGESGSGKTLSALSILRLLPGEADFEEGEILLNGKNLFKENLREFRGSKIGMVFQEPFTYLNPVMTVKTQILETIKAHKGSSCREAHDKLYNLLNMVKLPSETAFQYPHELSGGMQQRVMLAIALSCDPDILILDEPTTALDVSIQKHILDLIKSIQNERRLTVLFITHDFSVVNMIADIVYVMKDGKIVEFGPKEDVLKFSKHKYTKKLIECMPRLGDQRKRLPY